MRGQHPSRLATAALAGVLAFAPAWLLAAEKVEQVVAEGEQRTAEGKASQQRIDKLGDEADKLLREYRQVTKVVDGLQVYNGLLQKQVDNQVAEMEQLRESIGQVALIERQIVPLMVRMIDALEQFVALDVPFLVEERQTRVGRLSALLERADVTAAEKFRKVLEAYQVENDYGRTIEAYKGSLEVAGKSREVDFLRLGRVGLYYQTVGGAHSGAWDQAARQWLELPAEQYKNALASGLRIARKQVAPDLLTLPVAAPQAVQ
ncbi:MAG TPA: DUF3450 domain-containing protein [Gammaproteobacteria bacterium]